MKLVKPTILTAVALIAIVATAPADATWYSYGGSSNSGWTTSGGWSNSGWGSSGWGSSGWGSSGYVGTTSSSTSTSSSSAGSSSEGTPVPEPSNLLMLALGVAGLAAGRYAARKKRNGPK